MEKDLKRKNVEEACVILGCSKPTFYKIRSEYKLEPVAQYAFVKLYALTDLKRIKKLLEAK